MSNVCTPKGESVLLRRAREEFVAAFGRAPVAAACAPGRVNLMGDHVDYCGGLVLPMALPYVTVAVGDQNQTGLCNVRSLLPTGEIMVTQFSTKDLTPGPEAWANYIKGVVAYFPGPDLEKGFDMVIASDVPLGAGLSSSASLELAVFTFLEAITKTSDISGLTKAKLCQKAEHDFARVPCGIMDQYVGAMGKKGYALLIDCHSLDSKHVQLKDEQFVILVINSNVKHELAASAYPERRAHCFKAAEILGLPTLGQATPDHLKELAEYNCEDAVLKRAKHVVSEIARTAMAAELIAKQQFEEVGKLFSESHKSLSELMQVSCPEIDAIVTAMGEVQGVLGARMTGGGFGGCVVALVKKDQLEKSIDTMKQSYQGTLTFYICSPCDGAKILKPT